MDNMYRPTGGADPQDSRSTEQFWAPPPAPSGPGPQGPAAQPPPSLGQHYARDRRHALRWSIGLTLAVALAAGGVLAGVALAGHGAPASSASPAGDTSAASQPGGQAAALNTALNAAAAPGTLTLTSVAATTGGAGTGIAATGGAGTGTAGTGGSTAGTAAHPCLKARAAARAARLAGRPALARAARAAAAHCRWIRRRLVRVFLLRGIDGQFTFRTRQGTIRTLAFERGVIESVSGSDIVVRAADGTTWSWDLVSNTVVREHGTKTSVSALASGEPVWVGGPVVSGAKDARLVVIRPPSPPTSSAPTSSAPTGGAPSATTPAPSASGS